MKNDRFVNRRQVAEMLSVSERTTRRLVEKGELPAPVRVGGHAVRWSEAAVRDYMARLSKACAKPAPQSPQADASAATNRPAPEAVKENIKN